MLVYILMSSALAASLSLLLCEFAYKKFNMPAMAINLRETDPRKSKSAAYTRWWE